MTYLFVIMALGLINATIKGPYYELIVLNLAVVGLAYALDGEVITKNLQIKTIEIDSVDNVHLEKQTALINDLRSRTGLDIKRVDIEHIDFSKSRVQLRIYYY